MELWKNGDAVCFDVDSTVCIDEGIDELAEFCGAGKAVAEWTARFDYSNGFLYFFERGFMFLNFFGVSFVIFD